MPIGGNCYIITYKELVPNLEVRNAFAVDAFTFHSVLSDLLV
jgi:hypothetical protein